MMKYIPFGVRGWTDIADAARTRVLGFLGMRDGLVAENAFDEGDFILHKRWEGSDEG